MKKRFLALVIAIATIFCLASCKTQQKPQENGGDTQISYADFKGKTVMTVGQGGTPDVIFRHLMAKNGIGINGDGENSPEKVTIKYATANQVAYIIQSIKKGEADYALLGEPAATTVAGKTEKKIVLDLQKEFVKVNKDVNFVQAGLFVSARVSAHSAYINALVDKLGENKAYVDGNVSGLSDIFKKHESTLGNVAFTKELVDNCNVGCKKAGEIKNDVIAFLNAVKEYNPAQIGGALPGDDFYYDFTAANNSEYAKTSFTVGVVDGAPTLAVANILDGFNFSDGETTVSTGIKLEGAATNIVADLASGEIDMAIAPLNMASNLYNKNAALGIKLASVNIFGCLYLVG